MKSAYEKEIEALEAEAAAIMRRARRHSRNFDKAMERFYSYL